MIDFGPYAYLIDEAVKWGKPRPGDSPEDRFKIFQKIIDLQMDKIHSALKDLEKQHKKQPERWDIIGSQEHIAKLLNEIVDFLRA